MPIRDAALGEIVWRHFERHTIAGQNANPVASQLSSEVSENRSVLIQLDAK